MMILLNASSSFKSFWELIGVLLIFIFVLVITYFTTRWMGGYQKKHTNSKNLSLIETIRVGNNKNVSIVKAGEKYFVISVGKDEVNVIGELTEEELTDKSFLEPPECASSGGKEFFQTFMKNMKDQTKQRLGKK